MKINDTSKVVKALCAAGLSGKYGEPGETRYVEVWKRAQFKCVYCGDNLIQDKIHLFSAQIDHLLPKATFPELRKSEHNLVLACYLCNQLKRDFNPLPFSSWKHERAFTQEDLPQYRDEFIRICSEYTYQLLMKKEAIVNATKAVIRSYGLNA